MGDPLHAYGDQALSAFDLDFLDGGQCCRTALGAGWNVRFEDVPAVRGFCWNKGDRSFPGWYYAATTGGHVGYESWLERDRLLLLDFDPDVAGIASQPFWLHWCGGDAKRRHMPDYFVRLADGRARPVDIRADRTALRPIRGPAAQAAGVSPGCDVAAPPLASVPLLALYANNLKETPASGRCRR
ncbi:MULTISPECIES: TnsA-like heteromeric transposase endonuclease subunit [unclassified Streptomyces]|uniref:TnsA-like heteromeric transposase endonuclease subunit n=1 Tax=unclassified Streptomyces TaxID=2593676 RepID=UPI0035DE788B